MPKPKPQPVSVYRFLDAREFLRRAYEEEKKTNKAFSHRYIAKVMGASSSSFFKDVLEDRVPLSPARAAKFANLFRLSAREADHFETLVLYTQAESGEEKDRLFRKLSGGIAPGEQTVLETSQIEYLSKWHYAAVRELLAFTDFRGDDYADLGSRLDPPLSAAETRDAMELLMRLRFVRKNAQGRYEKADKVVATGPGTDPESTKPGIRANLDLAARALDAYPARERPFAYLTLSVSRDSLQFIQERLRAVRREILDHVCRDENVDRLYQLNMQLFPLSRAEKRRTP